MSDAAPDVSLRPATDGDKAFFLSLATDPAVTTNVGDGRPWTHERAAERFARGHAVTPRDAPGGWWTIERHSGSGAVDPVGIVVAEPQDADELEVGIWLLPRAWGQGLAAAAVAGLLARPEVHGLRIVAHVDPRNERARRLAAAMGFTEERTVAGRYGNQVIRLVLADRAASYPALPDGYEVDDDPARLDRDAIWQYLSTEAYWHRWRTRAVVEAQIDSAWRVVAVYHGDRQVGFGRVISDGVALAYLADVYVLGGHRGRGLGLALTRELVEGGGGASMRWLLHTADAHGLYERLGFAVAPETLMERPGAQRPPTRPGGQ